MINGKNGAFRTNFLKNFPAVRKKNPALKGGGRRKTARSRLAALTDGNAKEKRRLFEALRNVRVEYLP